MRQRIEEVNQDSNIGNVNVEACGCLDQGIVETLFSERIRQQIKMISKINRNPSEIKKETPN